MELVHLRESREGVAMLYMRVGEEPHKGLSMGSTGSSPVVEPPADTHINFTEDDVNDAADDNQEVKHIPGVSKIALEGKSPRIRH